MVKYCNILNLLVHVGSMVLFHWITLGQGEPGMLDLGIMCCSNNSCLALCAKITNSPHNLIFSTVCQDKWRWLVIVPVSISILMVFL